jgi:GH43 family beta-xylosidase
MMLLGCVPAAVPDQDTSTAALASPSAPAGDFYNVLVQDGADPWVYRHSDGQYYFTKTTGGDVTLWRSRTLTGIDAGERKTVWRPGPSSGAAKSGIWAPELHHLDGRWYVYVAADDGTSSNTHRMFVLENSSADPFEGEFVFKGQITDPTNRWAIDGTVLEVNGQRYFIWSGWEGAVNDAQHLYIARMSNPWTLSSNRVRISTPTFGWETNTNPRVNEGPQVIVRNGVISLVYSASGSWGDSYCLGLITASTGADLLDPRSWNKRSQPIFRTANDLHGPGHHSFTVSPDGREDWIVYHTARWQGAGWTRQIRAQRFFFGGDHTPDLKAPVDPNQPIPLPSGEPVRTRIQAESGVLGGLARTALHKDASGGAKVGRLDDASSFVKIDVVARKAGPHLITVRAGNGTAEGKWANHTFRVNGTEVGVFHYAFSRWDRWENVLMKVDLREGLNELKLERRENFAELDSIDVTPLEDDPPFRWSWAGPIHGMHCTRIDEVLDPHTWGDNYFCSREDLGMRWSSAGPINGMRCELVRDWAEPAEHTWDDNFLCVPESSPYQFQFAPAGPASDKECVPMIEPLDPHTWNDNFMCWTRR